MIVVKATGWVKQLGTWTFEQDSPGPATRAVTQLTRLPSRRQCLEFRPDCRFYGWECGFLDSGDCAAGSPRGAPGAPGHTVWGCIAPGAYALPAATAIW